MGIKVLDLGLPRVTVHNVTFVGIAKDENGSDLIIIECEGEQRQIESAFKIDERRLNYYIDNYIGKVGFINSSFIDLENGEIKKAYKFEPYIDQSLRRTPELDTDSFGWICDSRPNGFSAPSGIIPGENGLFYPDETEPLTLRIPPEFIQQCKRYGKSPEEVLRGFIGDVSALRNTKQYPRADQYQYNGSDECDYAEAWIKRAYGHDEVDIDEILANENKIEQKELLAEDLMDLYDQYEAKGGDSRVFLDEVIAIVKKQTV